jgi:hypothetical protein
MPDDIAPEEKAEVLAVFFTEALGQLAAAYFLAGTLDALVEDFREGRVSFSFSGLTVETPAPVSPPSGN